MALNAVKQVIQSATETITGTGKTMTRLTGEPVPENKNSLTAGPNGPVLFQDRVLWEKIVQFNREQQPLRNVHAMGTGAQGYFLAEHDVSNLSRASVFVPGTQTEIAVRFSGTFTERGDPDTTRDLRGFAIKFYTTEGNWDLMAINTPVFNVRDMKQGPDAVHAFKRNPITGDWNADQSFDYVATHPEGLHQVLMIWTDRIGTPASFRAMNAFGCNTFSFINSENKRTWVKFHIVAELGWKGLSVEDAKILAGENAEFLSQDLRDAIAAGNYPKYKLSVQVMPEEEGYKRSYAFDCTKVWPHDEFPLIPLGTIVLNKNPEDHFTEVESIAFSPMNVVPGISFSPDKLLQGRLLVYDDTQAWRLGPNFKQLAINCPHAAKVVNFYNTGRNGNLHSGVAKFPHYQPSLFGGPQPDPSYKEPPMRVDGPVDYYDYPNEGTDADYYGQCTEFYNALPVGERMNLAKNLAATFFKMSPPVVAAMMPHLRKVSDALATTIEKKLEEGRKTEMTDNEIRAGQLYATMQALQPEKPMSK